jgi:hypothetical protein
MKYLGMKLAGIAALFAVNGLAGPKPADAAWNWGVCKDGGKLVVCCQQCNSPFCDDCPDPT